MQRLVADPLINDITEATVFDGPAVDLDSGLPPLSVSSNGPELGYDSNQGIEVVFVTADTSDFETTTLGNIRITRAESGGQATFFKLLNETSPRKRTEAEIHHPTNDSPAIFYTQRRHPDDLECNLNDNMLRRARTGL